MPIAANFHLLMVSSITPCLLQSFIISLRQKEENLLSKKWFVSSAPVVRVSYLCGQLKIKSIKNLHQETTSFHGITKGKNFIDTIIFIHAIWYNNFYFVSWIIYNRMKLQIIAGIGIFFLQNFKQQHECRDILDPFY